MDTSKRDEVLSPERHGRAGEEIAEKVSVSHRAKTMQASPIRKLAALAEARKKKGITVYHLNIGQPDLPTPDAVFKAIHGLNLQTLAYAPSNGLPQAISAWK